MTREGTYEELQKRRKTKNLSDFSAFTCVNKRFPCHLFVVSSRLVQDEMGGEVSFDDCHTLGIALLLHVCHTGDVINFTTY